MPGTLYAAFPLSSPHCCSERHHPRLYASRTDASNKKILINIFFFEEDLDAAGERDGNATLCGKCSKALQKLLVCARCKTATYCSKDCQVHTAHRKRGRLAIKGGHGLLKCTHKHECE